MKLLTLLASLLFTTHAIHAQEAKADFPKAGFSITPPDVVQEAVSTQMLAQFLLPAVDGFSPNVNVLLFATYKDLNAFKEVTRKEFEDMGAKIVSEKQPTENSWVIEYTAAQNTTQLHFYARAEMKGGRIYLATATCIAENWDKHGPILKASVDSLKLK